MRICRRKPPARSSASTVLDGLRTYDLLYVIRTHKRTTPTRNPDAQTTRERETDGREGETERGTTARGPSQTFPVARTQSHARAPHSHAASLHTMYMCILDTGTLDMTVHIIIIIIIILALFSHALTS